MHDEFAGNQGTKTPDGYFAVEMHGYGDVRSFTPQGDVQYCTGKGCRFTQRYPDAQGNGGLAVCHAGRTPGAPASARPPGRTRPARR